MRSPGMWRYWRDKKGVKVALEEYYPELMASVPMLRIALNAIEAFEKDIDKIMDKEGEDDDNRTK